MKAETDGPTHNADRQTDTYIDTRVGASMDRQAHK